LPSPLERNLDTRGVNIWPRWQSFGPTKYAATSIGSASARPCDVEVDRNRGTVSEHLQVGQGRPSEDRRMDPTRDLLQILDCVRGPIATRDN
jgi:hypothetical protein